MKSLVLKYDAERSKGKGKLTTYLVRVSHENMNFLCVYVYFGLIIIRSRLSLKKKIILSNSKEGQLYPQLQWWLVKLFPLANLPVSNTTVSSE